MAHTSRGSFRRQDHGRGRGQGGRTAGGRGHGRGRGRGSSRGGRAQQPRDAFQTSRLHDTEDDVSSALDSDSPVSGESDVQDEAQSSEDDSDDNDDSEDAAANGRSYASLLQALNANTRAEEPPKKKRKLQQDATSERHDSRSRQETVNGEEERDDESEPGDAVLKEVVEEDDRLDAEGEEDDEYDSDDDNIRLRDPFETHYAKVDETMLAQGISAVKSKKKTQRQVNSKDDLRKMVSTYVDQAEDSPPPQNVKDLHLKRRLLETGTRIVKKLSSEVKDVASHIFSYRDVQFGRRTVENAGQLRDLACLHALNHIFKTRDRILKNNFKASQQDEDNSTNLRDQGFTRPKVLFIVPTKQACARFVDSIAQISQSDQQENKARFLETFSREDDESWQSRPEDFQELFGGNNEEDFRVGLKFTRKTIKYFSGFYNSDIIFSSALGLMKTITSGGGSSKSRDSKKKSHDADFLSSVEVVIVDHAAAIQMQNWQHLDYIFTQLNQLPKDSHGCDFGRVRNWYLDGHASYLRQTILFTGYHTPEINSLFTQHARNFQGLARYSATYTGAMLNIPLSLPYTPVQTFLRIDSGKNIATPDLDSNVRFNYFTTTIVPQLLRSSHKSSSGTLIVIPTYADFTRLRNYLSTSATTTSLSFGSISEYTPVKDVSRSRSHFINARHTVLLYTERAHHHFRYRLKGVKNIFFYGVPENPVFWPEFLAMLAEHDAKRGEDHAHGQHHSGGNKAATVRALFSKWDAMKLERIVGTTRIGRMLGERAATSGGGGGDMFEFV